MNDTRPEGFELFARRCLAALCGGVAGAFAGVGFAHLPLFLFPGEAASAAGLVLAAGFWGLPLGLLLGAILGVVLYNRTRGFVVLVATVLVTAASITIVDRAESFAMRAPSPMPRAGAASPTAR